MNDELLLSRYIGIEFMKDLELEENLTIAIEAARRGQAVFEQNKGEFRQIVSTSGRELKVNIDFVLENAILEELQTLSKISILSEESKHIWEDGLWWIVDPLDGSVNWLRGIPVFSVSIGLYRGLEPILGVVLDLDRDELFCGAVGLGAWMNDEPISVSKVTQQQEAVLCTGFPASFEFCLGRQDSLESTYAKYLKIRMLGSAAMSLAYVACGKVDIYWEEKVKLWDIAAGVALAQAAGGRVLLSEIAEDFSLSAAVAASQELLTKADSRQVN